MGATISIPLGQVVKTAVLVKNGRPVLDSFRALVDSKIQPGSNIVPPYIGDITVIGTLAVKVNRGRVLAAIGLANANLGTVKDVIAHDAPFKVTIRLAWC